MTRRPGHARAWGAPATALGLGAIAMLALLVRAARLPRVKLGDGRVVLSVGDAWYHARRALFSLENFPDVLLFDSYVNFPDGAWVPFPPLYDFALAAVARALGGTAVDLERTLVWTPALLGMLAVFPVYAAARALAGRATALVAALIAALLPIAVRYSEVGNADHHAAVALLGAALLAGQLAVLVTPRGSRTRLGGLFAALALLRWALLFTWQGSLLLLGVGDGALLAASVASGRRDLLLGMAASAAASALLAWRALAALPHAAASWSAVELSQLHVLFLAAQAALALGLAAVDALRPARGVAPLARAAALAALLAGGLLLALPGLRAELAVAWEWMGQSNAWGAQSAEQQALFGTRLYSPLSFYGLLAFAIPLAPLGALARARVPALRPAAAFLAIWTLVLGALALRQLRYGNEFAAGASVAFALLLAEAARLAGRWLPRAAVRGLAAALLLLLLAPALLRHATELDRGVRLWRAGAGAAELASVDATVSLAEFARLVREATPETGGYLDPTTRPEYGILSPPNLGHVLHSEARRATPADNFGPWGGSQSFATVQRFFRLRSERAALRVVQRLGTPYVVTFEFGGYAPDTLMRRLHAEDGLASEHGPRWRRFRLITEGPAGGAPLITLMGIQPQNPAAVPYKLFEAVAGAVIEVRAAPDTPVSAEVEIATPTGRRFVHRAEARTGADGVAQLRVPYATRTDAPARPVSDWQVRVGERVYPVSVSDADVRSGATLAVPPSAG